MHNDCTITFKLGLAAIRSLYRFDRLPPALHGVKQFDNCISAWPYGPAHAFYPFWPAHRPHCDPQLPCVHSDCIIALQLGLAAKRSLYRFALRLSVLSTLFGPLTARVARRVTTANSIQAWPYGQALSVIWTAYAASLAAKRSLYSLNGLPPALPACSDFPIAFQPGLTAKHMLSYPSARSPPALRSASACST
eukprot:scaffold53096_cov99-Phaeocystis_antarctica.AAC.1